MNEELLLILIEITFVLALAGLYYWFQRKRIIRFDILELYQEVDQILYKLNHFLDKKQKEALYPSLNSYLESLEKSLEDSELDQLYEQLKNPPSEVPFEIQQDIAQAKKKLEFHITKK